MKGEGLLYCSSCEGKNTQWMVSRPQVFSWSRLHNTRWRIVNQKCFQDQVYLKDTTPCLYISCSKRIITQNTYLCTVLYPPTSGWFWMLPLEYPCQMIGWLSSDLKRCAIYSALKSIVLNLLLWKTIARCHWTVAIAVVVGWLRRTPSDVMVFQRDAMYPRLWEVFCRYQSWGDTPHILLCIYAILQCLP